MNPNDRELEAAWQQQALQGTETNRVMMCNTDGKMRMADMDNEDAWLVLEFDR